MYHVEPGKNTFIEFSITNTRSDPEYLPENLTISITNPGSKGTLNKTSYSYNEAISYLANNDAEGTDVII